jgi:ribonuclease D
MELARRPIKELSDLARVRGLPRPIEKQFGQAILDTTNAGRSAPVDDLKQGQWIEDTAEHRAAVDALWTLVQKTCGDRGIDPALVTSRREVGRCLRRIADTRSLQDETLMEGWRGELLGQLLQSTLANHVNQSPAQPSRGPTPQANATSDQSFNVDSDENDDDENPRDNDED